MFGVCMLASLLMTIHCSCVSAGQDCVRGVHAGVITAFSFQIVTRGNDQVAISSKYETREDPGTGQLLTMDQILSFWTSVPLRKLKKPSFAVSI